MLKCYNVIYIRCLLMNSLNTDRKYTVILSAYTTGSTALDNMIATEQLHNELAHDVHVNPIRAVGVWQGVAEQAFVVHTNSSQVMGRIKRLGLEVYGQSCVLVINNRKHDVEQHWEDATTIHLGQRFKCHDSVPKGGDFYTVLNGTDYWSTAS